jgi:hypothetical protein
VLPKLLLGAKADAPATRARRDRATFIVKILVLQTKRTCEIVPETGADDTKEKSNTFDQVFLLLSFSWMMNDYSPSLNSFLDTQF